MAKPSPPGHDSDQIKVSNFHDHVRQLVERAKGQDAVRRQRVDSLRQVVQTGNYRVTASDIANAILKEEV
jgi:flagellar biosynthesis anti-sigma factor FlgM